MQIEYTKQAENVLKTARSAAKELRHPYIGTEHLLLGPLALWTAESVYGSGRSDPCDKRSK